MISSVSLYKSLSLFAEYIPKYIIGAADIAWA